MKCIYCGTRTEAHLPLCTVKLQAEIKRLALQLIVAHGENEEQSRLLGISAERELWLRARLEEANLAIDVLKRDKAPRESYIPLDECFPEGNA
jgi:hypothetical protein